MPRPKLRRRVCMNPPSTFFKPNGIPITELEIIELNREELEALRLHHVEGLNQDTAAEQMQTSQSTLHRLMASAAGKIATALVNGHAIKITE